MYKSWTDDMHEFLPGEPKRDRGAEEKSSGTETPKKRKPMTAEERIKTELQSNLEAMDKTHISNNRLLARLEDLISSLSPLADFAEQLVAIEDVVFGLIANVTDSDTEDILIRMGKLIETSETPQRKSTRTVKPVFRPGDIVNVTLVNQDAKTSKLIKRLKQGPQRLKIKNISVATVTFFLTQDETGKDAACKLSDIDMVFSNVPTPHELKDGMLIDVKYNEEDGSTKWYTMTYNTHAAAEDGLKEFVTSPEQPFPKIKWPFDRDEDEWRFPQYAILQLNDEVDVRSLDKPGWIRVKITGKDDDVQEVDSKKDSKEKVYGHVFWAEQMSDGGLFKIDVWYDEVKPRRDDDFEAEEQAYTTESETDDVITLHEIGDSIEYRDRTYKVTAIEEDPITYTLTSKEGDIVRIEEEVLEKEWSPEYKEDTEVLFKGMLATIDRLDYEQRVYIVLDAGGEEHRVAEGGIVVFSELPFHVGRLVLFDWAVHTIIDVDRVHQRYTLRAEDGSEKKDITQEALSDWCFREEKNVEVPYHITNKHKMKRGAPHYELKTKDGVKKYAKVGSKTITLQDDINNLLKDKASSSQDISQDVRIRVVYAAGTRVEVFGQSGVGIVQSHRPNDADPDKETYVVLCPDGKKRELRLKDFDIMPDDDGNESDEAVLSVEESTDEETSSESEEETEFDFDIDDCVTVDDFDDVYLVVATLDGPRYSLRAANGNELQNVEEKRLRLWEPAYEEGQTVSVETEYAPRTIEDIAQGQYTLDNGAVVTEAELRDYRKPLKEGTLVKTMDSKAVWEIVGFSAQSATYTLRNINQEEVTIDKDVDDVIEREGADYEEGDWVSFEGNVFKVVKVHKNATYDLQRDQSRVSGVLEGDLESAEDPNYESEQMEQSDDDNM